MSRGKNTKYCEMEAEFESLTKHDVKLTNTFSMGGPLQVQRQTYLIFWKQSETQLQKWKIIDYIAVPINW